MVKNHEAIMLLLVKCCDNKMVKSPGGSSCRSFFMRLTNKNKYLLIGSWGKSVYFKNSEGRGGEGIAFLCQAFGLQPTPVNKNKKHKKWWSSLKKEARPTNHLFTSALKHTHTHTHTRSLFLSHSLSFLFLTISVVYFDPQLIAAHHICWSKYSFFAVFHNFFNKVIVFSDDLNL